MMHLQISDNKAQLQRLKLCVSVTSEL